jgi:IPT/TIG domain/Bacterial TSP3 repeat
MAVSPAWAKKSSAPTVKSIHPLNARIGQKLTIRGTGFVRGKKKNTVVFMGAGKRVVWVKADTATTKTITVKLPDTLAALLTNQGGALVATKLQVRVIAKKSARSFTKLSKSPKVSPKNSSAVAPTSCVPHPTNGASDVDGDMLPDALEIALKTDPCKYDTDGDGISDGYEYQAALDLNRTGNSGNIPWPYPGKRPYPNPLDPSDANTDFDGDSLTLTEEYQASFAWKLGIDPGHILQTFLPYAPNPNPYNGVMVVAYSDGDQTTNPGPSGNPIGDPTGPAAPTDPAGQATYDVNGDGAIDGNDTWGFLDENGNGVYDAGTDVPSWFNYTGQSFLSDDEKDIDGDGLSNYDEAHGPLSSPNWWLTNDLSKNDGTYPLPYAGTNWLDRDTDGDGLPDGADDQDHDGYTNIEEDLGFYIAGPFTAWASANNTVVNVHAFNPCLPNTMSPACTRHPDAAKSYAPWKPGSRANNWAAWPAP